MNQTYKQMMPHKRLSFPWLVTRGDSSKAGIYVWENKMWNIK